MLGLVFDILGGLIFDLVPRPVRIGCLSATAVTIFAIFAWLWLR